MERVGGVRAADRGLAIADADASGTKWNLWDCFLTGSEINPRLETLQMAKKGIITTAGETISDAAGSAATMATDMAASVALAATGTARKAVRGARRLLPNVPKKRRAAAKRKVTPAARKVRKATASARRSAAARTRSARKAVRSVARKAAPRKKR